MLYQPVSERDIYDGVRSLRAHIEDKIKFAQGTHRYDWLQEPESVREPAMLKMIIQFRDSISARDLRIEVMNVMMGAEHFSTKDLWLAEIYGWLSWMEEEERYPLILGAISMAPNTWHERLKGEKEVKRPKGQPHIPEEVSTETDFTRDPGFMPL